MNWKVKHSYLQMIWLNICVTLKSSPSRKKYFLCINGKHSEKEIREIIWLQFSLCLCFSPSLPKFQRNLTKPNKKEQSLQRKLWYTQRDIWKTPEEGKISSVDKSTVVLSYTIHGDVGKLLCIILQKHFLCHVDWSFAFLLNR